MFNKSKNNDLKIQPSSEEQFIADFFKKKRIKFEREVDLGQLLNDTKKFRRADFYLPKFRIYVEYFGLYNSTKEIRKEYDAKVDAYIKNGIPTIFLYPHELGILEYSFHKKALKVLKVEKFRLKKEYFKYRLNRFKENTKSGSFKTLLISAYIFYVLTSIDSGLSPGFNSLIIALCFFIILGSFFEILKDLRNYFVKDK